MAADATVTFLPRGQHARSRKRFTLPPRSRTSVSAGDIPELANSSFSITVDSSLPIVAERSMYFGRPEFGTRRSKAATTRRASRSPATEWYFGEGASGCFFDTFFLLGKPSTRTANVKIKYQLPGGGTVTTTTRCRRSAAHAQRRDRGSAAGRHDVRARDGRRASRSSPSGRCIGIAPRGAWIEAHNVFGVNEPGMKWGLAEGRAGGDARFQTYILIGNTTNDASDVRVTFLRTGGGATIEKQYIIPANSRFNVDVSGDVPELANQEFGAIVEVIAGAR